MRTLLAYKLFRIKDDKLYPLFINRKEEAKIGEWKEAKCYPTKGFTIRQGWHCTLKMNAPHLKKILSNGERRVWVRCLIEDFEYYQRPESQGGTWVLAQRIKILEIME